MAETRWQKVFVNTAIIYNGVYFCVFEKPSEGRDGRSGESSEV